MESNPHHRPVFENVRYVASKQVNMECESALNSGHRSPSRLPFTRLYDHHIISASSAVLSFPYSPQYQRHVPRNPSHDAHPVHLTMVFVVAFACVSSSYKWDDSSLSFHDRASLLVTHIPLPEKVAQLINAVPWIPRLNIRQYERCSEALHGVAASGNATVFPQAIGLAATFDSALVQMLFEPVSDEARAKHERSITLQDFGRHKGLPLWAPSVNIFRDWRQGPGKIRSGRIHT
jgi:hypothetical protein